MKALRLRHLRTILLVTMGLLTSFIYGQSIHLRKMGDKYGYVKSDGTTLIGFKYDYAREFAEGVGVIQIGNKLGLINEKGEEILPPKYSQIESFSCGRAVVIIRDSAGKSNYGYINKKGEEIVPLKYSIASRYENNVTAVYKNGEGYALIDTLGNIIVPHGKYFFFNGESFKNRIIVVTVRSNSKSMMGLIDAKGVELIPPQYDMIGRFEHGLAIAQKNQKYGYIDSTGKEVIPCEYTAAFDFKSGFACVKKILCSAL